jgi:AAA domain
MSETIGNADTHADYRGPGCDIDVRIGLASGLYQARPKRTARHQMTTLTGLVTGPQLQAASLPPLVWAVPGILPEGLGILAARPKAGKSCLVLGIGLAVAAGKPALGVEVDQRPVLYLALEDGWRRLDDRCRTMLGESEEYPAAITFTIDAQDAIEQAEAFVAENDSGLVILDTLAVVKPGRRARDDAYANDYTFIRKLKAIAKPGITFLVVHHTRKAEADNFLDTVSGTHGIAGAADFVMVLDRKDHDRKGLLHITGRDVAEASYSLVFDEGRWSPDGDGLEQAAQRASERQLGHTKSSVVGLVNSRSETRAADVTDHLGITPALARQTLMRLANEGRIARSAAGVYIPGTLSHSDQNDRAGQVSARDTGCDTPETDRHTVAAQSENVTTQQALSQPLSHSETLSDQGRSADRDAVTNFDIDTYFAGFGASFEREGVG